jgi:hypothetical protein
LLVSWCTDVRCDIDNDKYRDSDRSMRHVAFASRQDTARLVFVVSTGRPAQVLIFRLAFHFHAARFGIRLLGSACPDFVPACVKSSVHRAGTPVASMRDQLVLPRSGSSVILLAQSRSVWPKFIDCPRPGVLLLDSCPHRQRFGLVMSPQQGTVRVQIRFLVLLLVCRPAFCSDFSSSVFSARSRYGCFPSRSEFPSSIFCSSLVMLRCWFSPTCFPCRQVQVQSRSSFSSCGCLDNDFPFTVSAHQRQCSGRSHFFSCILCLLRVLLEPRSSVEDFSDPVLVLQFLLWIFLVL